MLNTCLAELSQWDIIFPICKVFPFTMEKYSNKKYIIAIPLLSNQFCLHNR